jgi:hypothetical protein
MLHICFDIRGRYTKDIDWHRMPVYGFLDDWHGVPAYGFLERL